MKTSWRHFRKTLHCRRRTYAAYAIHLGLACLAVGIAGSSLGARQREATLSKGESVAWAGRNIRFLGLRQTRTPEKLVLQAELEVTADGESPYTLLPAQEFHLLQNEWSTEVAIHSTWSSDFYTILHSGQGQDQVQLTLVENPLMRWMWLAGWLILGSAVPWFWPTRKRSVSAKCGTALPNSRRQTAAGKAVHKRRRKAA